MRSRLCGLSTEITNILFFLYGHRLKILISNSLFRLLRFEMNVLRTTVCMNIPSNTDDKSVVHWFYERLCCGRSFSNMFDLSVRGRMYAAVPHAAACAFNWRLLNLTVHGYRGCVCSIRFDRQLGFSVFCFLKTNTDDHCGRAIAAKLPKRRTFWCKSCEMERSVTRSTSFRAMLYR